MALPYNLNAAQRHLRASDPHMRRLVKRVGPCRMGLRRPRDPFRALLRSIVYQQLAGSAAAAIEKRLLACFEAGRPTPEGVMALSDTALKQAGLSRQKISYTRDLATRANAGSLPSARALGKLDDETIINELTQVRGVGRWTVQMMLMANLGRPDVWPVDDFGVRKGYMVCHGLPEMPTARALEPLGDAYGPWRSVASWYLWRAAEQG